MRHLLPVLAVVLLWGLAGTAHATPVFSENFDTGSATFTVNDPYWKDNVRDNGAIVKNSTGVYGNIFAGEILKDASGSGFFLFDGTNLYNGGGDPNIPAGHDQFYISPNFAVATNTNYNVSFFLTNANTINNASVQPEIGGQLLGAPVSAVGTFLSNGWQQFNFTWNSGANTTASLILHDFTQTPVGNDFGLDEIKVNALQPTPEPSTLVLMSSLGLGMLGYDWYRRKRVA